MADTKISALTDGVTAEASDRIPVARDPTGTPLSRYITPAYVRTYLLGLANSWLDAQTFVAPSAGTVPIIAKGASGQTASLQEWRDSANTVLASVSAAGSGTFKQILMQEGQASNGFGYRFASSNVGFYTGGGLAFFAHVSNAAVAEFRSSGIGLGTVSLSWGTFGSTQDVFLTRDAANVLALRNGASGQTSRVYGTYTDASNYRRAVLTMSTAGIAELKPEGAGTGASGNVIHISGLPTSNPGPGILWDNAGTPAIGT